MTRRPCYFWQALPQGNRKAPDIFANCSPLNLVEPRVTEWALRNKC